MKSSHAACSCGQLSLTATGDPVRISVCHCLACQRRSGSAFAAQARFPKEAVTTAGRSTAYVRTGDAGAKITFNFCPDCGATVYYLIDKMPETIAVPLGAFADPTFPAPKVSVYEARRHPWVTLPADLERYD